MASSSQFKLFLLFTLSIGPLLIVVPNFGSTLECYVGDIPDSPSLRTPSALKLNKSANLTTLLGIGIGMSSRGNDQSTEQCPAAGDGITNYCISFHCAKAYGNKMIKECGQFMSDLEATQLCKLVRQACPSDPKAYCRACKTDKCNNE